MTAFARLAIAPALLFASVAAAQLAPKSPRELARAAGVPQPEIVLLQSAGQEPVTPTFLLLTDRTVIFKAHKPARGYVTTRLDPSAYGALMSAIDPEGLLDARDTYIASAGENAQCAILHVWVKDRRKTISVAGRLDAAAVRVKLPAEVLRVFDELNAFSAPAIAWPPSFGVELRPMERSSEPPVRWPKDVALEGYNFKLPPGPLGLSIRGRYFEALKRMADGLKRGQAVLLQDRLYSISYQLPFPYADAWADSEDMAASLAVAAATRAAEPRVVLRMGGGMRDDPRSRSPIFALYADRVLIWAAGPGYRSTRLSADQYQALVARIAPQSLLQLSDFYDAVVATDPGFYQLHVWVDGKRKSVEVVGFLDRLPGADLRGRVPPEFLRAYDAITEFSPRGTTWLPLSIDVSLYPSTVRGEPSPWPKGWPVPDGARADGNGRYRISVPGAELGRVRELWQSQGGVYFRDRIYGIHYRVPFPYEHAWSREP
jgi:hypothetical protein